MDLDSANTLYQAGLPDETGAPDHMHYRAMHKRLGLTVIYNSPGLMKMPTSMPLLSASSKSLIWHRYSISY